MPPKNSPPKKASRKTKEILSYNPATGELLGRVPEDDLSLLGEKFAKAREAQKKWAALSFKARAKYLYRMRDYLIEHAEEIAELIHKENGKTRMDALATEVIPAALAASWYAKNAEKVLKPQKLKTSSILFLNKKSEIHRVPYGIIGIISPWNYPLSIPFGEICMALMAGNAVMLKVSNECILVGKEIEKIINSAELPEGLFNHVVGSGSDVAKAFFEHKIDKIFFTGSVTTGKRLMAQAAQTLTPLSLELGGKDPMIVLPDADLERATNAALWAGLQNAGQSCGAVERIYVHEKIYDEFVKLLSLKVRHLRMGYDLDYETDLGSLTTMEQLKIVQQQVKNALRQGAKVAAQCEINKSTSKKGFFYPATVLLNVNHQMAIMREETFGPVLPIMKFHNLDEAIQLANDSSMGLTSSIFTRDLELAKRIALRLETGVTTINDHLYTHGLSETPWGGFKESGIGRTHSALGLEEMTQCKLINYDLLNPRRNMWWYPFSKKTYEAHLAALRFLYPRNILEWFYSIRKLVPYMLGKMFTPFIPKNHLRHGK
ncbi:MAG: aldehyde dehydrogenase family protein [Leptospiraceae bacterium]|nr:aldehyde dehydrogenase family protein [Leptospiraceae bacterium]MDW8306839.1 aldehyde dehydrogenase family protein [Leptospiraceae bacterium]